MIDLPQTVSIREIHRDVKSKGEMNTMISLYLPDGTVRTQALVDCGAKGANYMDRVFVQENRIPTRILNKPISVLNVDGTENKAGKITHLVTTGIEVEERVHKERFLVTSVSKETVIVGYAWLKTQNPDINWKQQTIKWRKNHDWSKSFCSSTTSSKTSLPQEHDDLWLV